MSLLREVVFECKAFAVEKAACVDEIEEKFV